MSNSSISPNDGWWYYMMGLNDAEHSGRKPGIGSIVVSIILLIIAFILVGIAIATCMWYFLS